MSYVIAALSIAIVIGISQFVGYIIGVDYELLMMIIRDSPIHLNPIIGE